MAKIINISRTKYAVGQLVHHKLFDYRGVIVEANRTFQGDDDWYEVVARTRPPKDQPWYHVLVDGERHSTYVAERNLEPDASDEPIEHPLIEQVFSRFESGAYFRH